MVVRVPRLFRSWRSPSRALLLARRRCSAAPPKPIERLLVANRGEIACRVLRTARRMGVRTAAVFSDADRGALHASLADEAFAIGPPAAALSYLNAERILDAARRADATAIHPGYGFLSENADFADACAAAGIIFVGPPSSAIRQMGVKNAAKQIMTDAGVPVVRGYHGEDQSDERLLEEARRVSFPVMLKAVYGGGGKGMRLAMNEAEFAEQLESARREAVKAFGNGEMLVEQYIKTPRHVEVQIFGDTLGNFVYLYERDCSVQRRHQKVLEESPAPLISAETRRSIGEAAVRAARAVGYVGAGTVEFILDTAEQFYFMEMNTRLQVEHPVTEMVTDTDLVEWQLRVAQGEPLPIVDQLAVPLRGHSVEARVYAEDPSAGFMPGAGRLRHLRFPEDPLPPYLRVETGVCEGDDVSVHYDPMIAKLVAWGADRSTALRRLDAALAQTHIVGLRTNVDFLRTIIGHSAFQQGLVHTDFIEQHRAALLPEPTPMPFESAAAATVALLLHRMVDVVRAPGFNANDPFSQLNSFRVNLEHGERVRLETDDGAPLEVDVVHARDGSYKMTAAGETRSVRATATSAMHADADCIEFELETAGRVIKCKAVCDDVAITLFEDGGVRRDLRVPTPAWLARLETGAAAVGGAVAPMPGVVEKVHVTVGGHVSKGDPMVVMVAMKMEYVIRAHRDGCVSRVQCQEGDSVSKGAVLVALAEDDEAADDDERQSSAAQ